MRQGSSSRRTGGEGLRWASDRDNLSLRLATLTVEVVLRGDGGPPRLAQVSGGWLLEVADDMSPQNVASIVAGVIDGAVDERYAQSARDCRTF